MARQYKQRARKDYPASGIKKGDIYYRAKNRYGPMMRQLKPFKPSQLTQSPFLSGWLEQQETLEENQNTFNGDDIREAASQIQQLGEEAQDSLYAMPDHLQDSSPVGEMLQTRVDSAEEANNELEDAADNLDSALEDYEPYDKDNPHDEESESYHDWEDEKEEIENRLEEAREQAMNALEEIPE